MLDGVETIFTDMRAMMKKLKKESFAANSEKFIGDNIKYFNEMTGLMDAAEDKKAKAEEIGEVFTEKVAGAYANKKGTVPPAQQADLSMFMVYYVFPTILKTGNPEAETIADGICKSWHKKFKGNNISYTDYDSLYGGFRDKIFGIF